MNFQLLDSIIKSTLNFGAGSTIEDDPLTATGQRLLDAIVHNQLPEVQGLLENGADPNACLAMISSHYVFTKEESEVKAVSIDKAFLWKKIFGEAPTPVHVAVINVYHRNDRRRDLTKALDILRLLLKHGGDISKTSNNIFLRKYVIETNPLDLALGVQRMTLWMNLEKPEAAMVQAVDIMRGHYDPDKPVMRSHKVPFELVSLPLLDSIRALLFMDANPDICIVSSDDARHMDINEAAHEESLNSTTGTSES